MENREAIEYLNDVRNGIHIPAPGIERPLLNEQEKKAIDLAISALEKQEADRWIPVTEGLPEKDGHYLVTLFDETESWTELLYWNTTFGGRWQGLIEDDFSDIGNVSAWMPLPEPYQGER